MSEHLLEANKLPFETTTYLLQGMTKCSVHEFTRPFKLMPNQERVTQMAMPVSLVNTSSDTLNHVLNILHLANNYYHSLNTYNAWNVTQGKLGHHAAQHPQHTPICFNCGEPHLLPDCKRHSDEAKIARNRKAYMDKITDGPPRNGGRKKWTSGGCGDGPDRSHGSGVQIMISKCM